MRSQLAALQRQAAAEAAAGSKLQGEMEGLVGRLAEERNLVSGGGAGEGAQGYSCRLRVLGGCMQHLWKAARQGSTARGGLPLLAQQTPVSSQASHAPKHPKAVHVAPLPVAVAHARLQTGLQGALVKASLADVQVRAVPAVTVLPCQPQPAAGSKCCVRPCNFSRRRANASRESAELEPVWSSVIKLL